MKQYRIKIIERHNGKMCYIPQVGMLDIWSNLVTYPEMKQYVLIKLTLENVYETEEEALALINHYKKQEEILKEFEIKETTYKDIL
jgi:hypothetical protein